MDNRKPASLSYTSTSEHETETDNENFDPDWVSLEEDTEESDIGENTERSNIVNCL